MRTSQFSSDAQFVRSGVSVDDAFESCKQLATSHYENFTVASVLIERSIRRHLYSVYAFCRGVDDLGDEVPGNRLDKLDVWEEQLRLCYDGHPTHPWFIALQNTIETFKIPVVPFLKLIEANRRDQAVKRYRNYELLRDYCVYSANPVGHLVLYLFGHDDVEMRRFADHTCTALQLTNFWQDVSRDYRKGRIYMPQSDMDRFGVSEEDIAERNPTSGFRELMQFQVERTRAEFHSGYPLMRRLRNRRAQMQFALFNAGGIAVLDAIERQGWDTLTHRPSVSNSAKVKIAATVLVRRLLGMDPLPRVARESVDQV